MLPLRSPKKDTAGLFYQDGKDQGKETYAGDERRNHQSRPEKLTDQEQRFLNALEGRIACKTKCVWSEEAQPHIPHLVGAIKSFGDGDIRKGIESGYNTLKESRQEHKNKREMKKTISNTFWKAVTTAILALIAGGMIYYILQLRSG
jgi:hypothetical protein